MMEVSEVTHVRVCVARERGAGSNKVGLWFLFHHPCSVWISDAYSGGSKIRRPSSSSRRLCGEEVVL